MQAIVIITSIPSRVNSLKLVYSRRWEVMSSFGICAAFVLHVKSRLNPIVVLVLNTLSSNGSTYHIDTFLTLPSVAWQVARGFHSLALGGNTLAFTIHTAQAIMHHNCWLITKTGS
jgi:uncharacterized membrane protein